MRISLMIVALMFMFSCNIKDVSPEEEEALIEKYIAEKSLKVDEKTSSGMRIIFTNRVSTGSLVKPGQNINLNYTGKLLSDKVFDSGNFSFVLGSGQVIAAFDEGVSKMKVGEVATIIFPSAVGYGSEKSAKIPAYSPLVFQIGILAAK